MIQAVYDNERLGSMDSRLATSEGSSVRLILRPMLLAMKEYAIKFLLMKM